MFIRGMVVWDEEIKDILQRLLNKGYTPEEILEAFEECLKNGV
jgi:hypothetical protein